MKHYSNVTTIDATLIEQASALIEQIKEEWDCPDSMLFVSFDSDLEKIFIKDDMGNIILDASY